MVLFRVEHAALEGQARVPARDWLHAHADRADAIRRKDRKKEARVRSKKAPRKRMNEPHDCASVEHECFVKLKLGLCRRDWEYRMAGQRKRVLMVAKTNKQESA